MDRLNDVCTCTGDKGKEVNLLRDTELQLIQVQCVDCFEFIVVNFNDTVTITKP